ncbi:MAG: hypothetical protein RJA63_491 [Pseudomonadota bacterium]
MLPMRIPLKPSPAWLGFLLLLNIVPVVCAFGDGVPVWARGVLSALALGSLLLGLRRAYLNWCRALVFQADGGVLLMSTNSTPCVPVTLVAQSCFLGCVQSASWLGPTGKLEHASFFRDGFAAAEWRALRRHLRVLIMCSSA